MCPGKYSPHLCDSSRESPKTQEQRTTNRSNEQPIRTSEQPTKFQEVKRSEGNSRMKSGETCRHSTDLHSSEPPGFTLCSTEVQGITKPAGPRFTTSFPAIPPRVKRTARARNSAKNATSYLSRTVSRRTVYSAISRMYLWYRTRKPSTGAGSARGLLANPLRENLLGSDQKYHSHGR